MVLRSVVSRADSPTFFLRVPCHRQLSQNSSRRKVQITTRMISGTDDVVDFLLEQVHFPALLKLVTLLEEPALTAQHAVITVGGRMEKSIVLLIVLNHIVCRRAIERAGHRDALKALINLGVTGSAGTGVNVVRFFYGMRRSGVPFSGTRQEE